MSSHVWLVCGSRTFKDYVYLNGTLDTMMSAYGRPTLVVQGGARGADALARSWAFVNDVECVQYDADWEKHGKRAGYLRNVEMFAKEVPDRVFAFIDKPLAESKGTQHMVNIATEGGAMVEVFHA